MGFEPVLRHIFLSLPGHHVSENDRRIFRGELERDSACLDALLAEVHCHQYAARRLTIVRRYCEYGSLTDPGKPQRSLHSGQTGGRPMFAEAEHDERGTGALCEPADSGCGIASLDLDGPL